MDKLYTEFIDIAKKLNSINIIPVLYGSLGLSKLIKKDLNPQDIDILIPERFLTKDWDQLKTCIEDMRYNLFDAHEHEFHKNDIKIAFASEESLILFADVDYMELQVVYDIGTYKILRREEYMKVYTKSLTDGYRKTKNNGKDQVKIEILKSL
jgi:hypothetical protein